MSNDCYLSFCPVAKVSEIIEPRWTLLILCELYCGASRFNEIRRGLPGLSPTLLSKRLKELEGHGLVNRHENWRAGEITYVTTQKGSDLMPIVMALGKWAHRNVDVDVSLHHLDSGLLMWNVRRKSDVAAMPVGAQWVIEFVFPDQPADTRTYWLVVRPGQPVDLCTIDPCQDVDLYVHASLRAMTSVFLGYSSLRAEVQRGTITLTGDRALADTMPRWFVATMFAAA